MKISIRKKRHRSPSGQGITEYSACIAFVCCIIALAFNLAQGSLFGGISTSFSTVSGSLDQMNSAAQNHPGSGN